LIVATTPWIAFIACDSNSTNMDPDVDIFTIVRDKGAKAAVCILHHIPASKNIISSQVLYSEYSNSCIITDFYMDLDYFERIFDIFSMKNPSDARCVFFISRRRRPTNIFPQDSQQPVQPQDPPHAHLVQRHPP
jgi:hypothetical protein